jgi:hypothetical protein
MAMEKKKLNYLFGKRFIVFNSNNQHGALRRKTNVSQLSFMYKSKLSPMNFLINIIPKPLKNPINLWIFFGGLIYNSKPND